MSSSVTTHVQVDTEHTEDTGASFPQADSVVARDGRRGAQFHSPRPSILIVDLDRTTFAPISTQFGVTPTI